MSTAPPCHPWKADERLSLDLVCHRTRGGAVTFVALALPLAVHASVLARLASARCSALVLLVPVLVQPSGLVLALYELRLN